MKLVRDYTKIEMTRLTRTLCAGFFLVITEAFACSCIGGKRTVREEIKNSDAVIVGEIISKELVTITDSTLLGLFNNDSLSTKGFPYEISIAKYQLILSAKYKGKISKDTIEIYTGVGGGDCGVNFEVGKDYVIYGTNRTYFGQDNNDWPFPKGKNILWTDICSRTTLENQQEIAEIEHFRKKR
ncbi:hypothetical protein [Owenweeksia hongkongensis]|uniref:hypothetical protein n=1 Tax=Owenweeksia hongkongensis TaxID=253245 RepID=UPI003A9399E0